MRWRDACVTAVVRKADDNTLLGAFSRLLMPSVISRTGIVARIVNTVVSIATAGFKAASRECVRVIDGELTHFSCDM